MKQTIRFFVAVFILLLSSCKNDTARITFLYDNVSEFYEITDICIYINDSLVLNETLPPDKITNNWKQKLVELKKGKYKIRVKSEINQLDVTNELSFDENTDCIVEYQHSYEVDSLNTGSVDGKKHFMVLPMSCRH